MKYSRLIIFTLIAVIFTDILRYIVISGNTSVENSTAISTVLNYISISILIFFSYKEGFKNNEIPRLIKYFLLIWIYWTFLNLIRGVFFATDYWDWKIILLSSFSFSLIPLTFFIGKNLYNTKTIFLYIIKYLFVLGFLLIPLSWATNRELYSRIMIPISLFIIFIPFVNSKKRFIIIAVTLTSVIMILDFRSNLIKIGFSLMLLLLYLLRNLTNRKFLQFIQICLFSLPIILFLLAVTNNYNIFTNFSGDEGYYIDGPQELQRNFMADTRTGLYRDVLATMEQSGNWLMGEGAGGRYQTERFDYLGDGRGRSGSEVGILNILLYYGLIGVIIYFLLLFTVSYYAIRRSNNTLAQLLGLYIAFRWTFAFVEEFTQYDLNFYFFWITVGLVSSTRFREMTNDDVKQYLELR